MNKDFTIKGKKVINGWLFETSLQPGRTYVSTDINKDVFDQAFEWTKKTTNGFAENTEFVFSFDVQSLPKPDKNVQASDTRDDASSNGDGNIKPSNPTNQTKEQ